MTRQEIYKRFLLKSKEELIDELMLLHDRFKTVREFYGFTNSGKKEEHRKLIDSYKKKIDNALWPDGGWQGGLDVEMVSDFLTKFTKLTDNIEYQVELELYAIEQANVCANEFGGDFGEDYYMYIEEEFQKTLEKLVKHWLFENMQEKVKDIVKMSFEGYGHRDALEQLFYNCEDSFSRTQRGYR
jgi:hypothetical protein